jgi:hypothetical protein
MLLGKAPKEARRFSFAGLEQMHVLSCSAVKSLRLGVQIML